MNCLSDLQQPKTKCKKMIQATEIQNCIVVPNSTETGDLEPEFLCLMLYYDQGKKK